MVGLFHVHLQCSPFETQVSNNSRRPTSSFLEFTPRQAHANHESARALQVPGQSIRQLRDVNRLPLQRKQKTPECLVVVVSVTQQEDEEQKKTNRFDRALVCRGCQPQVLHGVQPGLRWIKARASYGNSAYKHRSRQPRFTLYRTLWNDGIYAIPGCAGSCRFARSPHLHHLCQELCPAGEK